MEDKTRQSESENEYKEVKIAVLDLDGKLIGEKGDTCWNLSTDPEGYKSHSLESVDSLVKVMLYFYDNALQDKEVYGGMLQVRKDSWFKREKEGVLLSILDASKSNFGEELRRLRVIRNGESYEVLENE
jgi:hypothetical protein